MRWGRWATWRALGYLLYALVAETATVSEMAHQPQPARCTWKPAPQRLTAKEPFGCWYSGPGGCKAGWQYDEYFVSGAGGKWWPAGMYRVAVPSVKRPGKWDAFCWNHRNEASVLRADLATAPDGPAPVPSGTLDERIATTCALFPDLQKPSATDDDLSLPVDKRKQRHENMTDAEVHVMVKAVVLPIAQSVPFPAADGGLVRRAFSAGGRKKRTPAERAAHTAEALRSVQLEFSDSAPYFPLGRPENRARKEKKPGSDHWEPSEMAKAAIHFHVIGTVVVVQPEVRAAAGRSRQ